MVFRNQGQRHGRAFHWMVALLTCLILGLVGYQWWINRMRHVQNDERVRELQDAPLKGVQDAKADPKDWPQWRGPHRDATVPADGLLTDWPAGGLKKLWEVEGGKGFSAVSVAGKHVVTMIQEGSGEANGKEVVVCWEDQGDKAKELWRHDYGSWFSRNGIGPRGTPTIDGDRVYTLGARGKLLCLALKDGKETWQKNLPEDFDGKEPFWGFSSSPLIEDDLLLINPGGKTHTVVALNKRTGKLEWKAALDDHPGYSSPVISEACGVRQVLFFLGSALVSLDPKTGEENWRFPWTTKDQVNAATPIVRGDYVFISSGYDKGCALVVIKGDKDKLRAEEVYHNNQMRNHFGSSVFVKDHVYGFDESHLVCIPFRKGKPRDWKEGKFHKGTLLAAGDNLIVLGEKGELALVEATPEEFREKASFQVTKSRCWTMPIVAQGRLYLRDEENVYCFDLRKE